MICLNDECPHWTQTGTRGRYREAVDRCPRCDALLVDWSPQDDRQSVKDEEPDSPMGVPKPSVVRPVRSLTAFLRCLLIAFIVVAAVSIPTDIIGYYSYSGLSPDVDPNAVLLGVDVADMVLASIYAVLFAVTGIVFLRWIYVTTSNLHALSTRQLEYSPGWAVGYYFIPFLNLFRPYQSMKEIWDVSHDAPSRDREVSRPAGDFSLLGWWWGAWIVWEVAARVASRVGGDFTGAGDYAASAGAFAVSDSVGLMASVLALNVVSRISEAYSENYEKDDVASAGADGLSRQTPPTMPEPVGVRVLQSGWGIASFALGSVILVFSYLVTMSDVVTEELAVAPSTEDSLSYILLAFAPLLVGVLVGAGIVLGIAGLSQQRRARSWPALGIAVNIASAAVVVGSSVVGTAMPLPGELSVLPDERPTPVVMLEPGENDVVGTGTDEAWLALEVSNTDSGNYVIDIVGRGADLIASLYDAADGRLLATDDDSGGDLDPRITVNLVPGSYMLRITEYSYGPVPPFTAIVAIAE